MEKSYGILIRYNGKILLVHPTNAKWTFTYSIPKGHAEENETAKQAASRECFEETGIYISPEKLTKEYSIKYYTMNKTLYYFIYDVKSLSEIGLSNEVLPSEQLQTKEVDWCGFLDKESASTKLNRNFLDILKHI